MLSIPLSLRLTTGFVILMIGSLLLGEVIGFHAEHLAGVIMVITILGLGVSLFIISRSHQRIDLAAIAPTLLKSTLDALTEGVVLIDKNDRIIIANAAFAEIAGTTAPELKGVFLSSLPWQHDDGSVLPWSVASEQATRLTGQQLQLPGTNGANRLFAIDCMPAMDTRGEHDGTMVTFDDVTRREEKNEQLEGMLGMLQKSRDEISRQNAILQELATRDSLTNCLNRRSFFERYEAIFHSTKLDEEPMSCIMADIDLFKAINDRHGHALGDDVICKVADELRQSLRATDAVCRYGGEEFCIILPGVELERAAEMSERARINISRIEFCASGSRQPVTITSSFGVASIEHRPEGFSDLIDRADKALYHSKNTGRNRVTAWQPDSFMSLQEQSGGCTYTMDSACADVTASLPYGEHSPANDVLTGLPNRKTFHSNIASAIQAGIDNLQHTAVIIIDLDKFSEINNTLGFAVGDELLREVSQRIVDVLRDTDNVSRLSDANAVTSIYRLGGDEFGILLTGLDCAEYTGQILNRVLDAITTQTTIQDNDINTSCRAGISFYPDDGSNADTLLKNASTALFHAKQLDQTGYKFFNPALDRKSLGRIKLEDDLRHAIEDDELEVFYQPKIDLGSGKINSVEALVR